MKTALFALASLLTFQSHALAETPELLARPPQFVLISFDGSSSHKFWEESLALADKVDAKFSYFISGVYFVKKDDKMMYNGPRHKPGHSDIGFAHNEIEDIQGRTEYIWDALDRGFDIGSHVNGHFDGTAWNKADWTSEFKQFKSMVLNVFKLYPDLHTAFSDKWADRVQDNMKGFRAPLLAENLSTQQVLKDFDFAYDASRAGISIWPSVNAQGIWNVPLAQIDLVGTKRHTIAMDYNMLYGQCNGQFNKRNSGECAVLSEKSQKFFEDQTYLSYINAFLKSYYGNRSPLSIGHHFSLFNKGIYWKALQRFAYAVCSQPEVKCVTNKDMVGWMKTAVAADPKIIKKLNQGLFNKAGRSQVPAETLKVDVSALVLEKTANESEGEISEISDAAAAVMLKGALPAAHQGEEEIDDMSGFRVAAPGSQQN